MYESRFSPWCQWRFRNELDGIQFPGVYGIAIASSRISSRPFSWRKQIAYIGMTNAATGLKGRLKQFDNTVAGKSGHGGADRVLYKYQNYKQLSRQLFVSIAPFKCDPKRASPSDLIEMGKVAQFEYMCLAEYVKEFDKLPEFNDKKLSLKFSRKADR